jgi:hypothetical protein
MKKVGTLATCSFSSFRKNNYLKEKSAKEFKQGIVTQQ